MKIAVLGGSFNPPHLGHLLIAKQILEFTDYKKVWLLPCFQHTFQKELALAKHRLKMVKLLENSHIKCSDLEIKAKLGGSTLEALQILHRLYPRHQFAFIIGSDNLPTFKKWILWEKLVLSYRFLVFPRPGFDYDLKKYGLNNSKYQFQLIKHPLLATSNISSTLIRKRHNAGLSIDFLLPEKVKNYVRQNKLYR
jgi:nicotinate-nucleotide adenylyltransferase